MTLWERFKKYRREAKINALTEGVVRAFEFEEHSKVGLAKAREAIEIDPSSFEANRSMGFALVQHEKYREGVKYLERAVELNPTDSHTLGMTGCVFLANLDDHEAGFRYFKMALSQATNVEDWFSTTRLQLFALAERELHDAVQDVLVSLPTPERPFESDRLDFQLGRICWRYDEPECACAFFERALEHDPECGETHYFLALVYEDLGLLEQAREHFVESNRIDHLECEGRPVSERDALVGALHRVVHRVWETASDGGSVDNIAVAELPSIADLDAHGRDPRSPLVVTRDAESQCITRVQFFLSNIERDGDCGSEREIVECAEELLLDSLSSHSVSTDVGSLLH